MNIQARQLKRQVKSEAGFSLIELMVVVAIIGILATIAVPNFTKFQNKAKQIESKTYLTAIFTAEKAFSAEWESYTTCMEKIGFDRDGNSAKFKYSAGFITTFAGPGPACTANYRGVAADMAAANFTSTLTAAATTFVAGASGTLATRDSWTINEVKVMANEMAGL